MINILAILLVYGIFIEEMRISFYRDRLKQEKKNKQWDKEWAEMDKRTSIDLARVDERLKISNEEYQKSCKEFHKQCEEFQKRCKEV